MDALRMVFGKWGGRPHWEFDAVVLGDDEHGTWLGVPSGTSMQRPGAVFRCPTDQVVLLPDAPFVASFYAPGDVPCDTYVDISTVPEVAGSRALAVDLDLDVLRGWTGRVWVDDEDEFADHRVRFGYPPEVVDLALSSCEEVRAAMATLRAPFDDMTGRRWLDVLAQAGVAR